MVAEPDKQWRDGYSVKSLAVAWHRNNGFPQEVRRIFENSDYAIFRSAELLLAIPEHKVPLPGGGNPSQNDLFVLAKGNGQIIFKTLPETTKNSNRETKSKLINVEYPE